MHLKVSKYEDFDGNLGFKNRSTELEICSSAHKISGNSHTKDMPQIGISSKYSWIQTNAETALLRKTVIPSRPYDNARMRSVTPDAQINVSSRCNPI